MLEDTHLAQTGLLPPLAFIYLYWIMHWQEVILGCFLLSLAAPRRWGRFTIQLGSCDMCQGGPLISCCPFPSVRMGGAIHISASCFPHPSSGTRLRHYVWAVWPILGNQGHCTCAAPVAMSVPPQACFVYPCMTLGVEQPVLPGVYVGIQHGSSSHLQLCFATTAAPPRGEYFI